ncbi:hypothetical protein DL771_004935 [Monosporascus sp. 5C6A]|nr:hypothetical protein DL771_004935 [Monosporascus sp. 5C6A]
MVNLLGLAQHEVGYAVKSLRALYELSLEEIVIEVTEERRAILRCTLLCVAVSFTDFTAAGRRVLQSRSKTVKRVTPFELSGNDPAIVCGDVDPQVVAPGIAMAALMNSGHACIAIKRVFIHEAIYQKVVIAMVEFIKTLKVGDGFEEISFIGPIANSAQFDRV